MLLNGSARCSANKFSTCSYPSVSTAIVSIFACTKVDDVPAIDEMDPTAYTQDMVSQVSESVNTFLYSKLQEGETTSLTIAKEANYRGLALIDNCKQHS